MSHEQPQIDDQVTETPQIPGLPSLKAQLKAKQEVFDSLLKQATKQMLQSCVDGSSFEDMRKFVQKTQENLVNMLVFKQQADEEACSLVDTGVRNKMIVEDEKKLILAEYDKLREEHTGIIPSSYFIPHELHIFQHLLKNVTPWKRKPASSLRTLRTEFSVFGPSSWRPVRKTLQQRTNAMRSWRQHSKNAGRHAQEKRMNQRPRRQRRRNKHLSSEVPVASPPRKFVPKLSSFNAHPPNQSCLQCSLFLQRRGK
ncbi:hypothetical protein CRE_06505 [Caenorhabditis remanei]|uniref:Uncharacterized protein n=1 Tax=Caenorhabditis remanei TaxID=31234 RepID=E3M174_CAERE|nr:hypothetical protein CRE_06505 [Caenorhabditis remanei]